MRIYIGQAVSSIRCRSGAQDLHRHNANYMRMGPKIGDGDSLWDVGRLILAFLSDPTSVGEADAKEGRDNK